MKKIIKKNKVNLDKVEEVEEVDVDEVEEVEEVEEVDVDDIFDIDTTFEIDDSRETVVVNAIVDDIEELLDESYVLFDETNIKNKVLDILQNSYSEKIKNSPNFLNKLQNYTDLIIKLDKEKNEVLFKNKYTINFQPIVDIKKNIFIHADENEIRGMYCYDEANVNEISMLDYLNTVKKIKNNKEITEHVKNERLFIEGRPFENDKNIETVVDTNTDAIYMWDNEGKIVVENIRLMGSNSDLRYYEDKVYLKGVFNNADQKLKSGELGKVFDEEELENGIIFNISKYKEYLKYLNEKSETIFYLDDNNKKINVLIKDIDENFIKYSEENGKSDGSGGSDKVISFDKNDILSNDVILFNKEYPDKPFRLNDIFIKQSFTIFDSEKDLHSYFGKIDIVTVELNKNKKLDKVFNVKNVQDLYPKLCENTNFNNLFGPIFKENVENVFKENNINNKIKIIKKSKQDKNKIKIYDYSKLFKKIKEFKPLQDSKIKKDILKKQLEELVKKYQDNKYDKYQDKGNKVNKINKSKFVITLDKIYPNAKIYDSLDKLIIESKSNKSNKTCIFKCNGVLYPLYKKEENNEWYFEINNLIKDIEKISPDYYFDWKTIEIKNSISISEMNDFKQLKNDIETINNILKDDSVDFEYESAKLNKKAEIPPYEFTYSDIKDKSNFIGDINYVDLDDIYNNPDSDMFYMSEIKEADPFDDEDTRIFTQKIKTPKYLINNIISLLNIKLNDSIINFMIDFVDIKTNANKIKEDVNNYVKTLRIKLQSSSYTVKQMELLLKKLENDANEKYKGLMDNNDKNIIILIFSLLIIFVQLQLPEICIDMNKSMCRENIGILGYPINEKKTQTLIGYMACVIKQNGKMEISGFEKYKTLKQESIGALLQKNIESLLKEKPVFRQQLDIAKQRLLESNIKNVKSSKNEYWQSFRPSAESGDTKMIKNKSTKMITGINDNIKNRRVFKLDHSSGKPRFMNSCCIRDIDSGIYDDIIEKDSDVKNLYEILHSTNNFDKNKLKLPVHVVKKERLGKKIKPIIEFQNSSEFNKYLIETFPKNKTFKKTNVELLDFFTSKNVFFSKDESLLSISGSNFEKEDNWDSFTKIVQTIFSEIKNNIPNSIEDLNIVENSFIKYNSVKDISAYRNILYYFLTSQFKTYIGRIKNSYKINETEISSKIHIPVNIRKSLIKIIEDDYNLDHYDLNEEKDNSDNSDNSDTLEDSVSFIYSLYFESDDNSIIFKNIMILIYVFMIILKTMDDKLIQVKSFRKLSSLLDIKFTLTNINNFFEQQREDSKQSKMKQINNMNEETRELYNQFKKNNLDINMFKQDITKDKNENEFDEIYRNDNTNDNGNNNGYNGNNNGNNNDYSENIIDDYLDYDE